MTSPISASGAGMAGRALALSQTETHSTEVVDITRIQSSRLLNVSRAEWSEFLNSNRVDEYLHADHLPYAQHMPDNYSDGLYVCNPTGENATFIGQEGSEYWNLRTCEEWRLTNQYDIEAGETWRAPLGNNESEVVYDLINPNAISLGRSNVNESKVARIMQSMRDGVRIPAVVLNKAGQLLDGNHRVQASINLNLDKIPFEIYEG